MTENEKLGKNIRALRKFHGESQENLGVRIGVEKTAISNYESGRRMPAKSILDDIARHYLVSTEELWKDDFSGLDKVTSNYDFLWLNMNVIFPIISSDKALANRSFSKAYHMHKDLYGDLRQKNLDHIENLYDCLHYYGLAYDEEECITNVAEANILAILYPYYIFSRGGLLMLKVRPAALFKMGKDNSEFEKFLKILDNDEVIARDVAVFLNDLWNPDLEDLVDEFLTELKKSHEWNDLADYYLTLKYIIGMVNNHRAWSFNRRIGEEMLRSNISFQNRYAICLLKGLIENRRKSSQIVNDKI